MFLRIRTLTALAASAVALNAFPGQARAEFTGITAELTQVEIDGACWDRWRVYAEFDGPGDQLMALSGFDDAPLVISTDGAAGFLQVTNPAGDIGDTPPSAFMLDYEPMLAFDTFVTIDGTNSWTSDDAGPLQLIDEPANRWNNPTAFDHDRLVLNEGAWYLFPGLPQTFAAEGRIAIGQFTIECGATLDGSAILDIVYQWCHPFAPDICSTHDETLYVDFSFNSNDLQPDCPGDTDGNGLIDNDDLANVMLDMGTDGSARGGDADGDGDVDIDDLIMVVTRLGACA